MENSLKILILMRFMSFPRVFKEFSTSFQCVLRAFFIAFAIFNNTIYLLGDMCRVIVIFCTEVSPMACD